MGTMSFYNFENSLEFQKVNWVFGVMSLQVFVNSNVDGHSQIYIYTLCKAGRAACIVTNPMVSSYNGCLIVKMKYCILTFLLDFKHYYGALRIL